MPRPGFEDLRCAFQELGEGNEKACDGKPKIPGAGTTGSRGDEANQGSHVS